MVIAARNIAGRCLTLAMGFGLGLIVASSASALTIANALPSWHFSVLDEVKISGAFSMNSCRREPRRLRREGRRGRPPAVPRPSKAAPLAAR